MKIIVAVKQVPERDAQIAVAAGGKWIDEGDLTYAINEPDAYALEEALQLKEKNGGEVIALCAGPERVTSTLREALAKGADRAIHILADDLASRDTLAVAQLLADAIRPEAPDLILTGLQSDDLGLGQTGVVVAELLGIPHAHADPAGGEDGDRAAGESRTGGRLVSAGRHAAAGAADDSVRRQQAALRDADGDQEGEVEGDTHGGGGCAGGGVDD